MKNLLLIAAIVLIAYGITCSDNNTDKPTATAPNYFLDASTLKSDITLDPSKNSLEKAPRKIKNRKAKGQQLNPAINQTRSKRTLVKKRSRVPASGHLYIRGPRGGCYYINGNGNKTYVDRSLCN